jgi:hypothetical protein
MNEFFKTIDTIIWGRKTYDLALTMGEGRIGVRSEHTALRFHPPPGSGRKWRDFRRRVAWTLRRACAPDLGNTSG